MNVLHGGADAESRIEFPDSRARPYSKRLIKKLELYDTADFGKLLNGRADVAK